MGLYQAMSRRSESVRTGDSSRNDPSTADKPQDEPTHREAAASAGLHLFQSLLDFGPAGRAHAFAPLGPRQKPVCFKRVAPLFGAMDG